MKRAVRPQGFTIVELLIYSGILSIFLIVLTTMFTSVLDVQLESEATSSVATDSRYLFSRFAYDIGRAQTVSVPASLGEQSATLTLVIDGATYVYGLLGENIVLTTQAGTDQLNSFGTRISGLSFRRYGNADGKHSIRIAFTVTSRTLRSGARPEQRSFQTTIGMR